MLSIKFQLLLIGIVLPIHASVIPNEALDELLDTSSTKFYLSTIKTDAKTAEEICRQHNATLLATSKSEDTPALADKLQQMKEAIGSSIWTSSGPRRSRRASIKGDCCPCPPIIEPPVFPPCTKPTCNVTKPNPPCEDIQPPQCEISKDPFCTAQRQDCKVACGPCELVEQPVCKIKDQNPATRCHLEVKECETIVHPNCSLAEVNPSDCYSEQDDCKVDDSETCQFTIKPCKTPCSEQECITVQPPCTTTTKPCFSTTSCPPCSTTERRCRRKRGVVKCENVPKCPCFLETHCPDPVTTCGSPVTVCTRPFVDCSPEICQSNVLVCKPPKYICPPARMICKQPKLDCNPVVHCPEPEVVCGLPEVECTKPKVKCPDAVVNCGPIVTTCDKYGVNCPEPTGVCRQPEIICGDAVACPSSIQKFRPPPQFSGDCKCDCPRSPLRNDIALVDTGFGSADCVTLNLEISLKFQVTNCEKKFNFVCEQGKIPQTR